MDYQRIIQKIMEQLAAYKKEVDEIAVAYSSERTKHEEELSEMQGKYTESYIEESRQNWKPKVNYGKIIDLARETHQTIAENCLDELKNQLDKYFQVPVDSGFASTLSAIGTSKLTLNDTEFKVLEGAANGYWSRRLLNHLGVSRTTPEQQTVIENGQPKTVNGEKKKPYTQTNLPDIEAAYASLKSVENAISMAFSGYCGKDYALKDIVFPQFKRDEEKRAQIEKEYGVKSKPQVDTMAITKMANAEKFFDESHRAYIEFSKMMSSLEATMPKSKRKETLTDNEKILIDKIINPNYPALAQDEAITLAKIDGHLADILRLDSRYGEGVRKALGEA